MKQSHIRERLAKKRKTNKQEKLKTKSRDTSYKSKSKLVVIRRNIQHFTGTLL